MPHTLTVALPICRYCGRYWRPAEGVAADHDYCSRCSTSRHAIAATAFQAAPLSLNEMGSDYLLPVQREVFSR